MNLLQISHLTQNIGQNHLNISGSKSESNRLLVLKYLINKEWIESKNLSNSQDTQLMEKALKSSDSVIDIHHAGTAMRFLTAYFAVQEGKETILTGSSRMKERPIGILVDALRQLGAEIFYVENEGFPPLKIIGKKITKNQVRLSANVSSQYISALLLIGGFLENGLIISLEGQITSAPYLNMTIQMLNKIGIDAKWVDNQTIQVLAFAKQNKQMTIAVESDWSSASYLYSIVALAKEGSVTLETYYNDSLQGDKALVEIYKNYFNVQTEFLSNQIKLSKLNQPFPSKIEIDLNRCPDIAQTILVTASALKIPFKLTGLHTLKIKETDRLTAMQNELAKCNVATQITNDSIESLSFGELPKNATISTYNDHRMAMAFVPFILQGINLMIENPEVVEKSYPNFWKDMQELGFTSEK